jgi:hypothetical protein
MPAVVCVLALLAMLFMAPDARAQENLDRNLTGPKLFATSCATCHKSARGLAKGRMSLTLSYYLRQHYTSSAASAQTLTAYLQSVDTPPAKAKPPPRQQPPRANPARQTSSPAQRPRAPPPEYRSARSRKSDRCVRRQRCSNDKHHATNAARSPSFCHTVMASCVIHQPNDKKIRLVPFQ